MSNGRVRLPPGRNGESGNGVAPGWTHTTLDQVTTKVGSGATPKGGSETYLSAGIPLIRSMNVHFDGFRREGLAFLSDRQASELDQATVQSGDVLLNITGASIGRVTQAPAEMRGARVNQHVCIIRPNPAIEPTLLARFLASPLVQSTIWTEQYGVTRQALTKAQILAFDIPVPPLAEQRRIVAALESILTKVANCQTRLARVPTILKRFRQAVLAAACSGRLTAGWRDANPDIEPARPILERLCVNGSRKTRRGVPDEVPVPDTVQDWELPETWAIASAAELLQLGAIEDLKDGNHGANHPKVSEFSKIGLPFITAAQVNRFQIDYEGAYKITGAPLDRLRVGFSQPGDVVYTHKGSVGRVAIADRACVLTPQTTYYRVDASAICNRYLMYFLASSALVEQVNVVKEQTTRDFVPISEQYSLFHRIPPLTEQQEIVRRVDALFAVADQIEARYLAARRHVDRLTQSVLAKAFRGELVPTEHALAAAAGRDYEPAADLLERIRAAQPLAPPGRKNRVRRSRRAAS